MQVIVTSDFSVTYNTGANEIRTHDLLHAMRRRLAPSRTVAIFRNLFKDNDLYFATKAKGILIFIAFIAPHCVPLHSLREVYRFLRGQSSKVLVTGYCPDNADISNVARTHMSLNKDLPVPRSVQTDGKIVSKPILSSLHHIRLKRERSAVTTPSVCAEVGKTPQIRISIRRNLPRIRHSSIVKEQIQSIQSHEISRFGQQMYFLHKTPLFCLFSNPEKLHICSMFIKRGIIKKEIIKLVD